MSYHSYHVYGYGIKVSDYNPTKEGLNKLLTHVKARETRARVEKYLCTHYKSSEGMPEDINEVYYDYEPEESDMGSCYGVIADAISEITHVNVHAYVDYYGDWYLLYLPGYPWTTNKTEEKLLTKETIDEIMRKNMQIVCNDSGLKVDCDYQECENGG